MAGRNGLLVMYTVCLPALCILDMYCVLSRGASCVVMHPFLVPLYLCTLSWVAYACAILWAPQSVDLSFGMVLQSHVDHVTTLCVPQMPCQTHVSWKHNVCIVALGIRTKQDPMYSCHCCPHEARTPALQGRRVKAGYRRFVLPTKKHISICVLHSAKHLCIRCLFVCLNSFVSCCIVVQPLHSGES